MKTDLIITRTEGDITIHTATIADRARYVELELQGDLMKQVAEVGKTKGVDLEEIIWDERYKTDCIMFAIVENESGITIGFCEIEHISTDEPTLGISLEESYRGKGYGYSAAKAMIAEGWKIFDHDYFVWEVDKENEASKKLAVKLGGQLINHRCVLPEHILKMMRESGMDINIEDYPNSVERYKIERPRG